MGGLEHQEEQQNKQTLLGVEKGEGILRLVSGPPCLPASQEYKERGGAFPYKDAGDLNKHQTPDTTPTVQLCKSVSSLGLLIYSNVGDHQSLTAARTQAANQMEPPLQFPSLHTGTFWY